MTIRLHPFGQAELDQRSSDWVTSVLAGAEPSVVSSERADVVGRVAKGGYPVVQELNPRLRADWLRDYVNRLVERDAVDVAPAQVGALRRLLSMSRPGHCAEALGDLGGTLPGGTAPKLVTQPHQTADSTLKGVPHGFGIGCGAFRPECGAPRLPSRKQPFRSPSGELRRL